MNTGKYTKALEKHRKERHSWGVIAGMIRVYSGGSIQPQLMCEECHEIISVDEESKRGQEPQPEESRGDE